MNSIQKVRKAVVSTFPICSPLIFLADQGKAGRLDAFMVAAGTAGGSLQPAAAPEDETAAVAASRLDLPAAVRLPVPKQRLQMGEDFLFLAPQQAGQVPQRIILLSEQIPQGLPQGPSRFRKHVTPCVT